MLSSIHPLGERSRNNAWILTVGAFAVGAVGSGAAVGAIAALTGALSGLVTTPTWLPVVVLAAAAAAELWRIPVPTYRRQVNERWIGAFRGWVYGLGFGGQLGSGFATYVVTWAVPAWLFTIAWLGDIQMGAALGAIFGLGRTLPLIAAGWIDRPDRLSVFNRSVADLAATAHATGGVILIMLAISAGLQI